MTTAQSRLSDGRIEKFREDGYLIYDRPVLPADDFQALRDHFERKLEAWNRTSSKSPEHMDTPHFADPGLFRWLMHDDVLDLVEPLIGPDIALFSSHFISKPASTGKRVPWHEDSAYWGGVLDPMEVATVWLAIDPSTAANGCMKVVPGTHRHGYSDYESVEDANKEVFGTRIKPSEVDPSRAVDIELEPNQCSIHHAKLIHGSEPNRTNIRRCGYTMRYVPTTSRYKPETRKISNFQIYLARGEDRAGNPYGDPSRVNEAFVNADDEERRRMKALGH